MVFCLLFTDSPNSSSGLSSFSASSLKESSSSSSSTHQVSFRFRIYFRIFRQITSNYFFKSFSRKWSKLNLCPRWPQNRILWRVVKKIPIKRIIVFLFSVELKLKFVFLIQNFFCKSVITSIQGLYAWVLGTQSRTSNRKAWFHYPASLVRRFWEM